MKLKIEERKNQGIFILDVKGRLILGDSDLALRQRLSALLEVGQRNVIVNLKEVSDIDSAALGTLVSFAVRLREAAGRLVLLQPGKSQAQLPETLKLNTVFPTYLDELDAVNSFFPERVVSRYDILDFVGQREPRQALT